MAHGQFYQFNTFKTDSNGEIIGIYHCLFQLTIKLEISDIKGYNYFF